MLCTQKPLDCGLGSETTLFRLPYLYNNRYVPPKYTSFCVTVSSLYWLCIYLSWDTDFKTLHTATGRSYHALFMKADLRWISLTISSSLSTIVSDIVLPSVLWSVMMWGDCRIVVWGGGVIVWGVIMWGVRKRWVRERGGRGSHHSSTSLMHRWTPMHIIIIIVSHSNN